MQYRNPTTLSLAFVSAFSLALSACDTSDVKDAVDDVPSKAEVDDAKARVGLSSDALGRLHAALEFLGIIPVYTCGEPRSTFAGKLPESLKSGFAGATLTLDSGDPATDLVTVAFPPGGAGVRGFNVTGNLFIKTSGGSDRFNLEVDARDAKVDGKPVQTIAGYGTCGDSTDYWAESEGALAGTSALYALDSRVAKKAGLPLIGSTTLRIDAFGAVTQAGKSDLVTLTAVNYEVGKILPRSGTIEIVTSSGRRIAATFSDDTPLVGQVKVRVDGKNAVSIPLPGF